MTLPARLRATLLVVAVVALATVAGAAAPSTPAAAAPAGPFACETRAGRPDTVAVVVDFGDGNLVTRCTAPGGSGIDVLRRAGFSTVTHGFTSVGGDAAICAIGRPDGGPQVGCQTGSDCLICQAPDSWQYFPGYRYSQVGAGDTRPGALTVEAWRWGRSQSWNGAKPRHADVCVPAPPPTTAPPTTAPPPATTAPPVRGGGGGASSGGGGASSGGATPPGGGGGGSPAGGGPAATDPVTGASTPAPGGAGAPSTTAPGGSSTTGPAPAGTGAGTDATASTAADDPAASARSDDDADDPDDATGDGDERADGTPISSTGPGAEGGSGPPLGSFLLAAALVAVVGGLAVRARRRRPTAPSA